MVPMHWPVDRLQSQMMSIADTDSGYRTRPDSGSEWHATRFVSTSAHDSQLELMTHTSTDDGVVEDCNVHPTQTTVIGGHEWTQFVSAPLEKGDSDSPSDSMNSQSANAWVTHSLKSPLSNTSHEKGDSDSRDSKKGDSDSRDSHNSNAGSDRRSDDSHSNSCNGSSHSSNTGSAGNSNDGSVASIGSLIDPNRLATISVAHPAKVQKPQTQRAKHSSSSSDTGTPIGFTAVDAQREAECAAKLEHARQILQEIRDSGMDAVKRSASSSKAGLVGKKRASSDALPTLQNELLLRATGCIDQILQMRPDRPLRSTRSMRSSSSFRDTKPVRGSQGSERGNDATGRKAKKVRKETGERRKHRHKRRESTVSEIKKQRPTRKTHRGQSGERREDRSKKVVATAASLPRSRDGPKDAVTLTSTRRSDASLSAPVVTASPPLFEQTTKVGYCSWGSSSESELDTSCQPTMMTLVNTDSNYCSSCLDAVNNGESAQLSDM